ncbi:MAG: serine hydrolase domain-containing protein [Planctomycetota bacterium]
MTTRTLALLGRLAGCGLAALALSACSSSRVDPSSAGFGPDFGDDVEPPSRWRDSNAALAVEDPDVARVLEETFGGTPVPGAVAAIGDRRGNVRVAAYGLRRAGAGAEMTVDDMLHIGSDTKAMTAVVVARLVDRRLLSWDSTIEDVLPALAKKIHPDYRAVTVLQLLHHSSGAPANARDWTAYDDLDVRERRMRIATDALQAPPSAPPGMEFEYSNLGYVVAGMMTEEIGDTTWESMVVREVFIPLGIDSYGFGIPGEEGSLDQPWGHVVEASGRARPVQIDNDRALGPAGTVHLSIEDWARFALEFTDDAADERGFLSDEARETLVERGVEDYACGWTMIDRAWADGTAMTHSGSNTTWFATAWVAPRKNLVFLVAANAAGYSVPETVDLAVGGLLRAAETSFSGAPRTDDRVPRTRPERPAASPSGGR